MSEHESTAEKDHTPIADCQAAQGCVKDTGAECARTLCNAGIPDRHCDRCKTEALGLSSSGVCICRPGSCGWCEAGLSRTVRAVDRHFVSGGEPVFPPGAVSLTLPPDRGDDPDFSESYIEDDDVLSPPASGPEVRDA